MTLIKSRRSIDDQLVLGRLQAISKSALSRASPVQVGPQPQLEIVAKSNEPAHWNKMRVTFQMTQCFRKICMQVPSQGLCMEEGP